MKGLRVILSNAFKGYVVSLGEGFLSGSVLFTNFTSKRGRNFRIQPGGKWK